MARRENTKATQILLDLVARPRPREQVTLNGRTLNVGDMTVDQILQWQSNRRGTGVGRYGITRNTMAWLKTRLGLKGDEKFDRNLQDRMGVALMERRGLRDFLEGKISQGAFMRRLSTEWAMGNKAVALPGSLQQAFNAHQTQTARPEPAAAQHRGADGDIQAPGNREDFNARAEGRAPPGVTLLNPDLARAMERNPQIREYAEMTMKEAGRHSLDPNLILNQFWQESNFNPRAVSSAGARGIAQFMPATGRAYGLSRRDLFNPEKSIRAGVQHMADLTKQFGSQQLALVAYNGGPNAINRFIELGRLGPNPTIEAWMAVQEEDRHRFGTRDRSKWRVQTYEYVQKIDPAYWSDNRQQQARLAMENLHEYQLHLARDRQSIAPQAPTVA